MRPEPRPRPQFSEYSRGLHYHRDLSPTALPDRLRLVIENLGSPGRILDVGCHTGFVCVELRRLGWTVEGIEPNAEAAEIARSANLAVAVGSADDPSTWQGVGGDLDAVLLLDVLEHTYDPWSVLDMARTHLRPGGRVFVTLPNVGSWAVLRPLIFQRQFVPPSTGLEDPTHIRFFTLEDTQDLLKATDFDSIDVLPAWPCVPGAHRLRRTPRVQELWSRAWIRLAPSFTIAVPLLVARAPGT